MQSGMGGLEVLTGCAGITLGICPVALREPSEPPDGISFLDSSRLRGIVRANPDQFVQRLFLDRHFARWPQRQH